MSIRVKLMRHTFGMLSGSIKRLTPYDVQHIQELLNDYESEHERKRDVIPRSIINVTAIPDEAGVSLLVIARDRI